MEPALTSIQSGGFPSLACREFVHRLQVAVPLAKFLYFGDHDVQGGQQFLLFKYGAKSSAWASDSLVCHDLMYGGPTKAQLFDWHRQHCDADKWAAKEKALLQIMTEKRHTQVTEHDKAVVAGLQKFGLLDREPELAEEMRQMIRGQSVCQRRVSDKLLLS